ncbi:hypothetical protein C8F01DRAFT_1285015 [Mycena amicta]|nr:hypothetical protein C8F01DRAFT_1285015 [Mycena amicta]
MSSESDRRWYSVLSGMDVTNGSKYIIVLSCVKEMANPIIREKLHFFPKDTTPSLSQTWQSQRWRHELDADLTTPMIRIHTQDFYIHEPALLHDGSACIPTCWFQREDRMFIVDARSTVEVDSARFLVSFPQFVQIHKFRQLPDPHIIFGMHSAFSPDLEPWRKSNPALGNPWRQKAAGHRVVAFPVWLYCDDTSGNTSKKWNKHNSFLFTAAGLPRKYVHREFNVHFLSTSNIAPPLEMLDGIVDQLEECQKNGIWAWDAVYNELILVIPSVLAMLGDNPMQSEFACHIGFHGKFFCWVCWVKGNPQEDEEGNPSKGNQSDSSQSSVSSWNFPDPPQKKAPPKKKQTVAEMISHVTHFMKVGRARNRTESREKLSSQFIAASVVGGQTKYKQAKTTDGLKDTYQEAFLDRLFELGKKKGRTKVQKQTDMNRLRATFPTDVTSPVWRIKDLDPHQDTPVEILHVILLGFVKYFWQDAIARLKDPEKVILETRLSSFDVSGLGLSPLPGHTLVRYAGSLVGRDFRTIAQVAPFVLQGLLSPERVEAWVALSAIVTLVWQPSIENIDTYIPELEAQIDHFLDCTCRLSLNWFNKPKFHVIVHLPTHIRRFGPAMLFATKGFEKFNAIIRSGNIHSNRHAPSRDIAARMACGNRLRHLLSGGFFRRNIPNPIARSERAPPPSTSPWMESTREGLTASNWVSIHAKPKALVEDNSFGARFLGFMQEEMTVSVGLCDSVGPPIRWAKTRSCKSAEAAKHPDIAQRDLSALSVYTPKIVLLSNGDKCTVGDCVVYSRALGDRRVGQTAEIIQIPGSAAQQLGLADFVLITESIVGEEHALYGMRQL